MKIFKLPLTIKLSKCNDSIDMNEWEKSMKMKVNNLGPILFHLIPNREPLLKYIEYPDNVVFYQNVVNSPIKNAF